MTEAVQKGSDISNSQGISVSIFGGMEVGSTPSDIQGLFLALFSRKAPRDDQGMLFSAGNKNIVIEEATCKTNLFLLYYLSNLCVCMYFYLPKNMPDQGFKSCVCDCL